MNHDALYQQFGRGVRGHRTKKRLSQDQLAKRIRLSRTSITNIEKGRQKVLLHQVFEIAAALEVPPQALVPTIEQIQSSEALGQTLAQITEKLPQLRDAPALKDWVARVVGSPEPKRAGEAPDDTSKSK